MKLRPTRNANLIGRQRKRGHISTPCNIDRTASDINTQIADTLSQKSAEHELVEIQSTNNGNDPTIMKTFHRTGQSREQTHTYTTLTSNKSTAAAHDAEPMFTEYWRGIFELNQSRSIKDKHSRLKKMFAVRLLSFFVVFGDAERRWKVSPFGNV